MKKLRIACLLLAALPAVQLTGCSKTDDTLPKEVTTALETAFNRDDAAAVAAVFSDDAVIMPEHEPMIRGKDEILAFYKEAVDLYISFDTETEISIVRGNLGIEQGVYRVRNVRRGVEVENGKYVNVWKKVNGAWKLYRHIWNSDTPLAPTSASPAAMSPQE